ncbi:MAG TPA: hypothetical protein DDW67_05645 [Elusimicrobia bacterium]|nr:hypothetical protein [Elusimicrobiota bacterium]
MTFKDRLMSPGSWTPGTWLWLLMSICAVYAARHWFIYDGFVDFFRDEATYLPVIFKHSDPSLYPKDYFLANFHTATGFFLDVSSGLLRFAGGDLKTFLLSSSTVLLFVFVSGVFVLVRALTGNPAAAFLAGLLLIRPREAMGGVGFAVYVGNYQPRIFIDAVTPWLFWGLLAHGTLRAHIVIGVFLGLASWFYPVYPMQLAAAFVLISVIMKRSREALSLGAAFIVPFVLYHFPALLRAAPPLTETAVQALNFRCGDDVYPRAGVILGQFSRNFSLPLALGLAGFAACPDCVRKNFKLRSFLLTVPVVAVIIVAGVLVYLIPAALPLLPLRLGRLYHLVFLSVGAACAVPVMARRGSPYLKGLLALLVLANLLYTSPVTFSRGSGQGRRAEVTASEKDDFLAVAEAARSLTPVDAVFLIPPDGANHFSVYSRRAIVVSFKTLSSLTDSKILEYWFKTYRDVAAAYRSGDLGTIRKAASRYGADYVLLADEAQTPEPPLFRRGRYSIYPVGGGERESP